MYSLGAECEMLRRFKIEPLLTAVTRGQFIKSIIPGCVKESKDTVPLCRQLISLTEWLAHKAMDSILIGVHKEG